MNDGHTIDVGYVHVLNDDGTCRPNCPHPGHLPGNETTMSCSDDCPIHGDAFPEAEPDWRALTDDLAADYERLATRLTAASEGWFLEGLEALARYREARQR